jgi:aspartate/methionine/tyrosine aminotransferase
MNPLAQELNETIRKRSPDVFELLSQRGRALYMPRGIISQTAEANQKAHRINATIGQATEDHAPMALPSVTCRIGPTEPSEALNYAPTVGKPALREAWRQKLLAENPTLEGRQFGLPIVSAAITHGLNLVGDLFVDEGDRIVLPDKLWGNYRLIYETRYGAKIETFPFYAGDGFNVAGLREILSSGSGKTIALLNFPNNPTGYMPTPAEVEGMREAIVAAAEAGERILVVADDAYFGLVYDDAALAESPFAWLANVHPRVLTVKLDAATKEVFVWGLRCGFLTLAPPPIPDGEPLLQALEKKIMGAIRAGISSAPALSQSIVLEALRSETFAEERRAKLEILRSRAQRVAEVARRSGYASSWDVYPFNAGYFMCIRVKGVDAEQLRLKLLDEHGVGVIAIGSSDIRVAFSCVEEQDIEPLFECIDQAIRDLQAGR